MNSSKKIVIIGGPNGAGKTTFAREFLPREADCPDFINVDLIAAGLSPFDPDRAALKNFDRLYRGLVNRWILYDNSEPKPRRVAAGDNL